MKLKPSVKWTIAAVATVTTVTVSMGVIANAYTYNYDTVPETVSVFLGMAMTK